MNRVSLACALAAGAGLGSLYALFLASFLSNVELSRLDVVQSLVVGTMVGRLVSVPLVFGFARRVPNALVVLFVADVFVAIGLLGGYLLVPAPALLQLAHEVYSAAMTTLLVGLPACLISLSVIEMARNPGMTRVLLSVVVEVALLSFLTGHLSQLQSPVSFGDFVQFVILAARGDLAAGALPPLSNPLVILPSTAIYCALLVYSRVTGEERGMTARGALLLPLLGALFALGWLSVVALDLQSELTSLPTRAMVGVAPMVVSLAAVWLMARRAASHRPTIVTGPQSPPASGER